MKKTISRQALIGVTLGALLLGQHAAQAQERERHGLTIVAPVDGATLTGLVTVAVGTGGGDQGHQHQGHGGMHVFLLVDQPSPEPGATIQPDQTHIAFPEGQTQTTVTLPPGKHTLQLAVLDRDGKVGKRGGGTPPVSVTVQ